MTTPRFTAVMLGFLLAACSAATPYAEGDVNACGDHCDDSPARGASTLPASGPANAPVPAPDAGAAPAPAPIAAASDAGTSPDAASDAADASAADAAPPCLCEFPSAHGGTVTKACGATICWKPAAATVYSIWRCASQQEAAPTYQACSTPE